MKRLLSVALILVMAGLIAAASQVREEIVNPAVVVATDKGVGTGTLIRVDKELLVLTASHVVAPAYEDRSRDYKDEKGELVQAPVKEPADVSLEFRDGRQMKGKPVFYSPDWKNGSIDLSLVRPADSLAGLPVALLTDSAPEEGEDVYYCGTAGGIPWNLEKSVVNQVDDRYLTVNGNGYFGHSGSGVYLKRCGHWRLAAVLVQFQNGRNERSPLQCERPIAKFLADYTASKKQKMAKAE